MAEDDANGMHGHVGEALLRVGIMGCAEIAKKNIIAISKVQQACIAVVAIASRSLDKAKDFVAETKLESATPYGSYQELLDSAEVDAVYIPLPCSLHKEWVLKAAAAGKHVLMEKPLAMSYEDAEAMVDACRAANVQYMDGTMWLHNPRTPKIREVLDQGRVVGEARTVLSSFSFAGSAAFMANDVRCKADLDGMGCVGDLGWYCIGFTLFAFNYDLPSSVTGHPGTVWNEEGVPMSAGAVLLWDDGRKASFHCSFDRVLMQSMEVAGTQGVVYVDDWVIPYKEHEVRFRTTTKVALRDHATRITSEGQSIVVMLNRPQETYMWEEFSACVQRIRGGGAPTEKWMGVSLATHRVLCAVMASIREDGKTVAVPPL